MKERTHNAIRCRLWYVVVDRTFDVTFYPKRVVRQGGSVRRVDPANQKALLVGISTTRTQYGIFAYVRGREKKLIKALT